MRNTHRLLRFALAPAGLLLSATVLRAQAIPVDVELGYRWVEVSGNDQMYRTQINDRPGVLLRSLDYTSQGSLGFLDTLHIDGSDIGAGPAGQLRVLAAQTNVFKLTFTWRETDLYSALPAFANPFLDEGIVPGQQTWNRTRNIYDATLELLPGKMITPLLGYTRNVYGARDDDLPPGRKRVPPERADPSRSTSSTASASASTTGRSRRDSRRAGACIPAYRLGRSGCAVRAHRVGHRRRGAPAGRLVTTTGTHRRIGAPAGRCRCRSDGVGRSRSRHRRPGAGAVSWRNPYGAPFVGHSVHRCAPGGHRSSAGDPWRCRGALVGRVVRPWPAILPAGRQRRMPPARSAGGIRVRNPAASYSPRGSTPKYHRRWRA